MIATDLPVQVRSDHIATRHQELEYFTGIEWNEHYLDTAEERLQDDVGREAGELRF